MEDNRRERLMALFAKALELPSSVHEEWLAEACPDDAELREDVAELLREDARAAEYFEDLASSLFGRVPAPPTIGHDPLGIIGRSVARYEVLEHLGGGGMGVVYRAIDSRLRREVALKFLPPDLSRDPDSARRFHLEARAISRLDHPNICTVYEIDEFESRLFMAMAYCDGQTLKQRIASGRIDLRDALRISIQIARGLAHAHEHGIVHRDVKPANVLLLTDGRVRLVDFGLATFADRTQVTAPGAAVGTMAYMSPEQIRGSDVDARADVWSMGVLLYEMCTGRRPFQGSNPQIILYGIVNDVPEAPSHFRPEIPAPLNRVITRCLAKNADERYANAGEVAQALEGVTFEERRAVARHESTGFGVPRRALSTGGLAVALVAILLALPFFRNPLTVELASGDHRRAQLLAILPFQIDEHDPEIRHLSAGLAEAVGRQLAEEMHRPGAGLQVIPEHEVRRRGVSDAAGAQNVLGSDLAAAVRVRRGEDGVRVTVSLTDARTLRSVGTRSFETQSSAALSIHQRILESISSILQGRSTPPLAGVAAAVGTDDSLAFQHFVRGLSLLDGFEIESNVDRAIEEFQASIGQDPSFAQAHSGLCEAYWRKHEHNRERVFADGALQSCRRAIELDETIASVHVMLANVLGSTGRSSEALSSTDRALELEPSSAEALRARARILTRMGAVEEAEAAYQTAIRQRPGDWLGYLAMGTFYYRLGRHEEAALAFSQVTSIAPGNVWGYDNLGAAYFALERLDRAREAWEAAMGIREEYGTVSNLATLHFIEQRYTEAAEMYERALGVDDRDYALWGNLASAYYWAPGLRSQARPAFERAAHMAEQALAVNPNDPYVLVRLAGYEAMLGRNDRAQRHVAEALDRATEDGAVYFAAADVFERLGSRDLALNWIDRALEAGFPRLWVERSPSLSELRDDPQFE